MKRASQRPLRVIDTGIRSGRENIALDQALIEALKVPAEKLAKRGLDAARRRVITLREVLGRLPGFDDVQAALLDGFREALDVEPQWEAVNQDGVRVLSMEGWSMIGRRPR